tara:strand:+ start:1191 stop:3296 length:2106 start_codon:yes stop_codon:yes gene_type:complete
MILIKRIKVEVFTKDNPEEGNKYGFDYKFKKGLNIVAGQNSRGKTTINSCIYYALAMEELLGGQNDKAMDKSLKDNFTTLTLDDEEPINHIVNTSRIFLEIDNGQDVVSILRYVNYDVEENNNKLAFVYEGKINSINEDSIKQKYYVRGNWNNEDINGFYKWLTSFIGLELPIVSNSSKRDDYSPLYLQTIFSTILIEQTKGWSDFFATMPYYGITRSKEKVIEYILGLNQLYISTEKDVYYKKYNQLVEIWNKTIVQLKFVSKQYGGELVGYTEKIPLEKELINEVKVLFQRENKEDEEIALITLILEKEKTLEKIVKKPISTIEKGKISIIENYEIEKKDYYKLKKLEKEFSTKLSLEINQKHNLLKQEVKIIKEIEEHKSLSKVFDKSIINKNGGNYCPTCTQEVNLDIISSKNIPIPKLSLEENIAFLNSQRKLIQIALKSITQVIKEKEDLHKYYINILRKKEEVLKALSKDLIADDRAFSESDTLERVNLKKEINSLLFLHEEIKEGKIYLKSISDKYSNISNDLEKLEKKIGDDDLIIKNFDGYYKKHLFNFGYDSNDKLTVKIWKKQPFKYLPVYLKHREAIPQSLRVNSSASDFVRNIWSYTISLLQRGENHPGFIILDEPGQHRTNLKSLNSLFKSLSQIKDKQSIIFTSLDKKINNDETLDLEILLKGIEKENYRLIKLDDYQKVIKKVI